MFQEVPSGPAFASKLVTTLVFLAPALSLAITTITPLGCLFLAAVGCATWIRNRHRPGKHSSDIELASRRLIAWPLLLYAAVILVENLYHGERWGAYHVVLAIVVALPAGLAFSSLRIAFRALWLGAAMGAILAFSIALYQVFVIGNGRAGEHINPIPFGSLSLVLAVASVLGTRHIFPASPYRQWLFAIHLLGGVSGLAASLLSGSKGAWPAALVLALVAYRVYWKSLTGRHKIGGGALLAALLALMLSLPQVGVVSRLQSALSGLQDWSATGSLADGSVGTRLEMWKFALDVAPEKPWLGFGKPGMMERKQQAVDAGQYDPYIAAPVTLHNEFLHLWVTKGIAGVASLALVYGCAFLMFHRMRRSADSRLQTISLMGRSLIIMYLIFGLGEVAFQLNVYRNVFLFWILSLTGMALATQRDTAGTGG